MAEFLTFKGSSSWVPFRIESMQILKCSTVFCLCLNFDLQALQRALAVKQLLDPMFWQSHENNLMPSSRIEQQSHSKEDNESKGISWKVVWVLLRKVMDSQWLHLVPLLHRTNFWELHLMVLFILQSLSPGRDSQPQVVVVRLKVRKI